MARKSPRLCVARIGAKSESAVTTTDVMALLLPIWSIKRVTARRVRQRIGAVTKRALAQGFRADNPAGPQRRTTPYLLDLRLKFQPFDPLIGVKRLIAIWKQCFRTVEVFPCNK